MWNYSPKEFVKVYRKLVNWEWYSDANTTKIFLHCLLKANWKEGSWKGIHYEAGQFITSLSSLSKDNGLSERQVRTALNHLISTGEISSSTTDKTTGKRLTRNRIITVNNWVDYQTSDKRTDRQTTSEPTGERQASDKRTDRQTTSEPTGERQASDRQATGKRQQIEEYKNNRSIEEKNINNARAREDIQKEPIEKHVGILDDEPPEGEGWS